MEKTLFDSQRDDPRPSKTSATSINKETKRSMEEGGVHAQRKAPHLLLFGIVNIDDVGDSKVDVVDVVGEVERGRSEHELA